MNVNRTNRIQEYKQIKEQITARVKDLTKKMHDEEQDLQRQLDKRIEFETE